MFKSFILFVTAFLLSSPPCYAQSYDPLTPGSSYTCVTFPSGVTMIGVMTETGVEIVSAVNVAQQLKRQSQLALAKRRALTELRIDIREDGARKPRNMAKILDSYRKFVNGIDDPNEEIPTTKDEQLELVTALIRNVKAIEVSAKLQSKAAQKCLDRDPSEILPEGYIQTEILARDTGVVAVIYGKGRKYKDGNTYCIRGDDKAIQSAVFKTDPCSFPGSTFSCAKKGFAGFVVQAFINPGGFLSQAAKDEAVAYVVSKSSTIYEAREQRVRKDYTFVPCSEILD